MALTLFDLTHSWPARQFDLLLRACVLPESEARDAWSAWQAENVFDDISWSEIRLIAYFSGRIAQLDPASPLRPRIEGLARAHWTQNQAKLRALAEIADLLRSGDIPFLVFKGASVHVEAMAAMRRRVMGDVDILVRGTDLARALDLMLDAGWEGVNGESREYLLATRDVRGGGNYRKGRYGEVDLHRFAFHYSLADPHPDEELWLRARTAETMSRRFLVPSPTDSLIIGLVHASNSVGGDWALDAVARLAAPGIDWDLVVATARRRGLVPQIRAGLLYLKERLRQDVPAPVLDELARTPGDAIMQLLCWASARPDGSRSAIAKAASYAAVRVLPLRGYRMAQGDRAALAIRRPRAIWRLAPRRSLEPPPAGEDWSLSRELALLDGTRAARLFVELAVRSPPTSRRVFFDVSADGIGFARLRTRIGGTGGGERRLCFAVPLPSRVRDAARIKIEARPLGFLAPQLTPAQREQLVALPFHLVAAGLIG